MRLPDCPTFNTAASATPIAAEAAPLQLEELTQRCLGSIALVEKLLASFEQRFPIELSEIVESLDAQDLPRLVRSAHQLKGAAANMSAPALRSILEQVEHAGRAEQLAPIAGYLDQLQGQWQRFRQYRARAVSSPAEMRQPAKTVAPTATSSSENEPCES